MDDTEKLAKFDWHKSQILWHMRRSLRVRWPETNWHKRQARWHRKAIGSIPGLFTLIVARTFQKYQAKIAENVVQNNALLARMKLNR